MSLLPPILEGRISNFQQIWEGFLVVRSTTRNSSPKMPSITSCETLINHLPSEDVISSSCVSSFCEEEDKKSKFPADILAIECPM